MRNICKKLFIVICLLFVTDFVLASDIENAERFLKRAKITNNKEESYEYIHRARIIYEEEHEANPSDIGVLLGLSKVNQMLEDRANAKLYVLKAYNTNPSNSKLQKEMGDFYYAFQEYSTAIEYYKLSLASGNLRDFETNLQSAKCFEKLGDLENASLYYKICNHLDSTSRNVLNKVNEYESLSRPDDTKELEEAKYKYLFKDKKVSESEIIEKEAEDIIRNINNF